jgi:hypothetical protein
MIKKFKNTYLVSLLGFSLLTASGCAPLLVIGAVAGVGTITYVQGELIQNVDASVARIYDATVKALRTQKVFIFNDIVSSKGISLNGEYINGTKVRISVKPLNDGISKIHIRIGSGGDEEESRKLMDLIAQQLLSLGRI